MGFDDDGDTIAMECQMCGHVGLQEFGGFYYCQGCCEQAEDLRDTGVADEDFVEKGGEGGGGAIYIKKHIRHVTPRPTPIATVDKPPLIWRSIQEQEDEATAANNNYNNSGNQSSIRREPDYSYGSYNNDGLGPAEPEDFGSAAVSKLEYEDYYNEVRLKYVMGMQWMIELQCEALVREFHVSPLICGVASTVWLRFLAGTGVFKDDWANRVILESELEPQLPDRLQECKLEPVCFDESQGADSQNGLHSLSTEEPHALSANEPHALSANEPHALPTNEPHALSMEEPGYDDLLKDSRIRYPNEPYNSSGQRAVMIWFRCLRKAIPLSSSLAIVFLACHVAREAVLPTDIIKWSIEGKLSFFAAHVEIGKRFERPSAACPISTSLMFRPYQSVPLQKLESMAATVSESIGLHLPPVNFYEIASRYLKQLSLPVEKILPHACRIYEWSMPPDLWLSTNETKLPTRVYVLSILIVAIRILYDINGFGVWERSLSTHIGMDPEKGSCFPPRKLDDFGGKCAGNASNIQKLGLDAEELLFNLEKKYHELSVACDFAKDLPSYLQHCKDMIFAGARSSHLDPVEEELIEKLSDFYQNEKYSEAEGDPESQRNSVCNGKRSRNDDGCVQNQLGKKRTKKDGFESICADSSTWQIEEESYESPSPDTSTSDADIGGSQHELGGDQDSDTSSRERNLEHLKEVSPVSRKDEALRLLKLNMEENRFSYIPPRVNIKRRDYLHYVRKKDVGFLSYVAHADYYILLRSCAKVAQVDIRIMHIGVLSFERRLAWLEERIDDCVHLTPSSSTCEFCSGAPDAAAAADDDLVGLSQLDI